ncbi:MAG: hypothetical protein GTO14_07590 [Anaerolineales bacterium]|nr:hypothetical protein [Anaerolineales bacterium]
MDEEKLKVVEKVVSRLTDIRMEFGPEERVVLDMLVTGKEPEVSAHAVAIDIIGRVEFDDEKHVYRVEI